MPRGGTVGVLIDARMALRAGKWLCQWTPPAPTLLGGSIDPAVATALNELGEQFVKAGKRRAPKRQIQVSRILAEHFINTFHPCTAGLVRLWPPEALKLRRRCQGALRKRRGPWRRERPRAPMRLDEHIDLRSRQDREYRRRTRLRLESQAARRAALAEHIFS